MFDMTEEDITLDWFTMGEPEFCYDQESGYYVDVFTIRSIDGTKSASPFLILKDGLDYRVGQLYDYEYDVKNDSYRNGELRHPAMIRQEYKIPHNVPFKDNMLGPMSAVNLTRVMRIVQAALSNETDVRADATSALKTYYEEKQSVRERRPMLALVGP